MDIKADSKLALMDLIRPESKIYLYYLSILSFFCISDDITFVFILIKLVMILR